MLRFFVFAAACVLAFGARDGAAISLKVDLGLIDVIGPSTGNLNNAPTPAFAQFQLGERVIGVFTFDETAPDGNANANLGEFNDPNASLSFTGSTTGVNLSFDAPLNISVRNNRVVINTEPDAPSTSFLLGTTNNLRIQPGDDFFTDPNNLQQSISELLSKPFTDELTNDTVVVGFFDTGANDKRRGIRIARDGGPVSEVTAVPTPVSGLLLISGVAALGAAATRRRR